MRRRPGSRSRAGTRPRRARPARSGTGSRRSRSAGAGPRACGRRRELRHLRAARRHRVTWSIRYCPSSPLEFASPLARRRVARVEQDAHRLERLRAEDHGARPDFVHLARVAVDVHDAASPVPSRIDEHLVHHRVGHERAAAGRERVGDGRERRVEVRVRRAAALARPAVVARRAAVDRLRQVRRAADRDRAAELLPSRASANARSAHVIGIGGWNAPSGSSGAPSACPRCRRSPRRCRSTARGRRSRAASRRRSRRATRP